MAHQEDILGSQKFWKFEIHIYYYQLRKSDQNNLFSLHFYVWKLVLKYDNTFQGKIIYFLFNKCFSKCCSINYPFPFSRSCRKKNGTYEAKTTSSCKLYFLNSSKIVVSDFYMHQIFVVLRILQVKLSLN